MFSTRTSLKSQKRCLVSLTGAPDGLPWGIFVNRGTPSQEYVKPVATALGYESLPEKWGAKLKTLVDNVQKIIDDRQFFSLEEGGIRQEFYISSSDMKQLFTETILRRIIDENSKDYEIADSPWGEEDRFGFSDSVVHIIDTKNRKANIDTENRKAKFASETLHTSSPKLAIQTNSERLGIIRIKQDRKVLWERYFIPEDLTHLDTAEFLVCEARDIIAQGALGKKYQELRRQTFGHKYQWKLNIKVSEIMDLLAGLALSLHNLHERGLVHTDLKPDNILITTKGMVAVDSMDIPTGENSRVMTRKYAAPEQIIREPVSPQTDQYALGVILSEIFGGVIYGEEVNYIIPTGGGNSARITLLKNPGILFDPTVCKIPDNAIDLVRALIGKCLNFTAADRFSSIQEIAEEMQTWNKNYDFVHALECPLDFGELKKDKEDNNYWWLQDNYK